MVLESRNLIIALLILAIMALIAVLFFAFQPLAKNVIIGDLSGLSSIGKDFVIIEMPETRSRISVPQTEVALFTNADDGFLALVLNCRIIALNSVGDQREIELPRFAAERSAGEICTGSSIQDFPKDIQTNLVRFVPDGLESYLADIKIQRGKNVLSAVLLNKQLGVLAQHTVTFDGAPEGSVPIGGDGVIANVTFNGSTIAVLNNTEYRILNITIPVPDQQRIFNGTDNITYNITSGGGLWMRTIFQDVAPVPPEFSDWRWIQVITTNMKLIQRAPPKTYQLFTPPTSYVDFIGATDDGQPYYYNDADHATYRHTLVDHPSRPKFPTSSFIPVTWSAEACHVGVKAGPDTILSCFTYGFDIAADGTVTLKPLTSTGTGTANFKSTVNGAFPGSVS